MVTSPSHRHIVLRSLLHNIGAFIVCLGVAGLGLVLGTFFNIHSFFSLYSIVAGLPLLAVGFWLRMWATICFYEHGLKIISTVPQNTLITSGPYRFTRNPLYLGGNVFMVFGASLLLGSPVGLLITAFHLPFVDRFIRREEKQLEQKYNDQWRRYKRNVHRWIWAIPQIRETSNLRLFVDF